jgi:hypothetical protein
MSAAVRARLRSSALFCAILMSCVACVEHVERKPLRVTAQPRAGQRQGAASKVIQRTCVSDAAGNETCRETTQ